MVDQRLYVGPEQMVLVKAILTMLVTSGEAPFCSRRRTMFKWPINAATCIGVRPDCETKQEQFYSSARLEGWASSFK